MILRNNLVKISNVIKNKSDHIILPYTKALYCLLLILEKYCVKSIYIIADWILVIFEYTKLKKSLEFKTFRCKDKENFFTYYKLKNLFKTNKHGIILTSKGIYSLNEALKLKEGGILLCLLYLK